MPSLSTHNLPTRCGLESFCKAADPWILDRSKQGTCFSLQICNQSRPKLVPLISRPSPYLFEVNTKQHLEPPYSFPSSLASTTSFLTSLPSLGIAESGVVCACVLFRHLVSSYSSLSLLHLHAYIHTSIHITIHRRDDSTRILRFNTPSLR